MTTESKLNITNVAIFLRSPKVAMARAVLKTLTEEAVKTRKQVDNYIAPVFARFDFRDEGNKQITTPRDLYLSDDDALCTAFYEACHAEHQRQGYDVVEVGICPALVAEDKCMKAENALLKLASDMFGFDFHTCYGKHRKQALDLFMQRPSL